MTQKEREDMQHIIATAVNRAIAAEAERCAAVCDRLAEQSEEVP